MSTDYFESLKMLLQPYLSDESISFVKKAYDFSAKAHHTQKRKSQEPYITHPVEVAKILAKLQQDPDTLAAALLHDTVEDTETTLDALKKTFNTEIAQLVEGVTKLGHLEFSSKEEAQAENFRKMFIAMANDLRVIIIKLADRLHNMRTLQYLSKEKQMRISQETREIFSPLAHRLGMWSLKWELEDLAFYYLQYDKFQEIKQLISTTREAREQYVNQFITILQTHLETAGIMAVVRGRPKHFYSIYTKLEKQQIPFDELYDTLGIRVIVDSIKTCYAVLGILHAEFKPISGRIKDYIAMPKSNGYQSLHTTVIGPEGKPVEIQIRTQEMHQTAEIGIAAHWSYKEGHKQQPSDSQFAWIRDMLETHPDSESASVFLQDVKTDLFGDEVFVFTPNGDVYPLPRGATPIDFAYRIHSEIGHKCIGAKVNNHIVPLHYQLKNGDRVEILTSKTPNPNLAWLQTVRTSQAKNKIKQWFRKQHAVDNTQKGKAIIEKALLIEGYSPKDVLTEPQLHLIEDRYNFKTFDELYVHIGQGDISAVEIVHLFDKHLKPKKIPDSPIELLKTPVPIHASAASGSRVKVLGERNVLVRMARCCNPLPGDLIIGYITLGSGVSVHRANCIHVQKLSEKDRARVIEVEWIMDDDSATRTHRVTLNIEALDRIGLMNDIVAAITATKTSIKDFTVKSKEHQNGVAGIRINLQIRNTQHLAVVKAAVKKVPDVYRISRVKR